MYYICPLPESLRSSTSLGTGPGLQRDRGTAAAQDESGEAHLGTDSQQTGRQLFWW